MSGYFYMKTKIIVFGTGNYYRRKREYLNTFEIIAFVDNDIKKQGQILDGKEIISPNNIFNYEYDYICVLTSYEEDVLIQLKKLGISDKKVLTYCQIGSLRNEPKNYNSNTNLKKCDIVLINNVMSYSGGVIAFFYLATMIEKLGFECVVLTVFDGPFHTEFERYGIPVYEEDFLNSSNRELIAILKTKKLVVCNTIYLRSFVQLLNNEFINTVWWLHESAGISAYNFEPFVIDSNNKIRVYGVGNRAIEAFRKKVRGLDIEELLYTVKESDSRTETFENSKICFAIIGTLIDYKGQDIFVEAIGKLSNKERAKCIFKIIGQSTNNDYCNNIRKAAEEIDESIYLGELSHNEIIDQFDSIDVVVCPSRVDTMPTVVVEGMMQKQCCIVSKKTGISDYIKDMNDGIILNSLNPYELKKKMGWIINNPQQAKQIGINSYDIYKGNFIDTVFEKNVKRIIDECVYAIE